MLVLSLVWEQVLVPVCQGSALYNAQIFIAFPWVKNYVVKMYCIVTDVSGGYSSSILDAIRKSIEVSKALSFSKPEGYRPISHHEALYMATLGGAQGNEPNS